MKKITVFLLALGFTACQNPEKTETEKPDLGFDLANLDTTVDPCTDFFQYTAGGWIRKNPIPETESRWGSFNILIEENNAKVKGLLDSVREVKDLRKGSYQQMVADFYKTGMDSMAVEEEGLKLLQPMLDSIESVSSFDDYLQLQVYLKKNGMGNPWRTVVDVDDKNSSVHILKVSQGGLGLPDRDYYLKDDSLSLHIQEEYRKHVSRVLVLSGYPETEAASAAEAIYKLEYKLAENAMKRSDAWDPAKTYHKMDAEEWTSSLPALKLDRFYNGIGLEFDSLVVSQPDFMKAVHTILPATGIQTLKDYTRWHVLDKYAAVLPYNFASQNFEFFGKTLWGSRKIKPRWKRVLSNIEDGLDEPLGHLFVDRYFPESSKKDIEEMIEDMRDVYRERINNVSWMGEDTKKKAIEKLDAFKYKIGYPDKWKDFEGLEIGSESYLANTMALDRYNVKDNLDRLNKPVDKDEWFMPPHLVNAYYSPSYNEVVFPAGILQPPFYNTDAEAAINYGGIGGVIGHELTHGFDNNGSQYDAHGNLVNWWTQSDSTQFEEKTRKVQAQYSAYEPLLKTFIDGKLTLGENIADLGGLTLGYYAYQKSLEEGREEMVIDGYT
ncbi:MAG TPA: M13 family peptidase [Cryomorphaceae bacterium]|nr:M13 family peptidase [Cryomorphaceae bacterium]